MLRGCPLKLTHAENLCTTENTVESLQHPISIQNDASKVKTFLTFRSDKYFAKEDVKSYNDYFFKLESTGSKFGPPIDEDFKVVPLKAFGTFLASVPENFQNGFVDLEFVCPAIQSETGL